VESGGVVLTDLTLREFAQDLGSEKPAPGGGSASGLAGALAASLVQMVGHLSGEGQEELISRSRSLADELLDLVNRDTEAFNRVMAAFRLPKTTEEEKKARRAEIQAATRLATEVPLKIAELSLEVLALAEQMAFRGNKNALSDAGVAGLLGVAACRGAAYNVLINLPGLKDEEFVAACKLRLKELLQEAEQFEETIGSHVLGVLS
jgi:formiminotetrahydrofolate cyclodeaminase